MMTAMHLPLFDFRLHRVDNFNGDFQPKCRNRAENKRNKLTMQFDVDTTQNPASNGIERNSLEYSKTLDETN